MAGDLASLERERATVLAGISHDLRTPLSRLRLGLELSGADRASFAAMTQDIDEIDAVIGQFLDYARGVNEERVAGDLAVLLRDLAADYARRGRRVAAEVSEVPPLAFAPQALRRAIANLVENALRHAGEPVELRARSEGANAVVEVLDRGPGIPESEAERLKQPFTRLDASRAGTPGAGLGLAIVERIVRSHAGRFELAPRIGGGLCARIVLPVTSVR
jgi:two-component system osmolarity sensor histidine kinase EnvZ